MKTTKYCYILILTCLLGSCEFNKSVNKNLKTGAYSKGDGIGCGNIVLQINGKEENRNVFNHGERIKLIFNDIMGLEKRGGKVFPGMSLLIIKNGKDTVNYNPDFFGDLKEGTDLQPLQLQCDFLFNLPFENQEKYKFFVKIWDKKGKGTFTYEMPFKVKANKLLKIKSNGVNYKDIYLWDQTSKFAVADKNVNSASQLILIMDSLSGLTEINGKVFPQLSIELTDSRGKKLLMNPNMLKDLEIEGTTPAELGNGQVSVTISFSPGKIYNPCQLKAVFTDRNSDKRINVETGLNFY